MGTVQQLIKFHRKCHHSPFNWVIASTFYTSPSTQHLLPQREEENRWMVGGRQFWPTNGWREVKVWKETDASISSRQLWLQGQAGFQGGQKHANMQKGRASPLLVGERNEIRSEIWNPNGKDWDQKKLRGTPLSMWDNDPSIPTGVSYLLNWVQ